MANKKGDISMQKSVEVGIDIIGAMDQEFHEAPDRVIAIVGAAYLDSLLEKILRAFFIADSEGADNLLKPDRPLGSNGARYQLAYCLGLIEKQERDDLRTIAKIRNTFAHRYDMRSFDHSDAKNLLSKLNYGKELDSIVQSLIQNTDDPTERKHLRAIGDSARVSEGANGVRP